MALSCAGTAFSPADDSVQATTFVQFNRDVSFCGYVATTTDGYAGPTGTVQGAAYGYPQEVFVYTVAGTNRVDLPFHVVVTCCLCPLGRFRWEGEGPPKVGVPHPGPSSRGPIQPNNAEVEAFSELMITGMLALMLVAASQPSRPTL